MLAGFSHVVLRLVWVGLPWMGLPWMGLVGSTVGQLGGRDLPAPARLVVRAGPATWGNATKFYDTAPDTLDHWSSVRRG
jgi:hypothetical protein